MLSPPLAALVAVSLLVTIYRVLRGRPSAAIRRLRGPPSPSVLLGHERALSIQAEAGELESKWLHEYGPTWRIAGYFGTNALMTADPKALQHIYHKSGYSYQKTMSQNFVGTLMSGPGIIVSSTTGMDHQRHRKIMNPAFSAAHLRSFLPLIQGFSSKLTDIWRAELTSDTNGGEMTTMVNTWFSRVTLEIVGEAAFNYRYGALDEGDRSPICKAYENFFKDVGYNPPFIFGLFRATWDYLPQSILNAFLYIPFEPFTRIRGVRDLYTEYGKQILHEQRTEYDVEKPGNSKDIMSLLVKANASGDAKTRLSDAELMAEMFTLTAAGHETTGTTLTFLAYELARHPEYQDRMRDEILATRARVEARGDPEFTMDDLDSLTLTLNAIKETLRMHNVVPYLPRQATKDDVIPLQYPVVSVTGETITEVPVCAGQVIYTSFAAYHRLKDVWGEDADEWNPDRWSRPEIGKQTNVGVFANLMTFSAGLRGCIGWRFSIIEMQAIVAELCANFQFSLPSEKVIIKRAPLGISMGPMIVGQEELNVAMPLKISFVSQ
ncbi:cytochrome P450 [Earliella scabrosa]|nr:cytochrome P450 [Earliella scabrosa]